MEHVKDTISVHPHSTTDGRTIGGVADRMNQLAKRRGRHLLLLVAILQNRVLSALAPNTGLDVDARLGGVAGLTRIQSMRLVGERDAIAVDAVLSVRVDVVGPLSLRMGVPVHLGGRGVALLARGVAGRGGLDEAI